VVRDSSFLDIGNDAIDISGTTLEVRDVSIRGIGDKALSGGENSTIHASGLEIRGASTGIASKDLSRVRVTGATLSQVSGSALMAFIKKPEYGPAEIDCEACNFVDVNAIAVGQFGSRILVNGEVVPTVDFSRGQMAEAGYLARQSTP